MKTFTNWLVKFGCTIKGFIMALVVVYAYGGIKMAYDENYAERVIKAFHSNIEGFKKKAD